MGAAVPRLAGLLRLQHWASLHLGVAAYLDKAQYTVVARNLAFAPKEGLVEPLLAEFLTLDDTAFRARFSGSPIKRIGRDRFVRNCLIAAGNSGNDNLLPLVRALCSDEDETVAEAAAWATGELTACP